MRTAPTPCPVCYADTNDDQPILTLPCAHRLCVSCLFQLRKLTCPFCRQQLFRHATQSVQYTYVIHESSTDDDVTDGLSTFSFYETYTDEEPDQESSSGTGTITTIGVDSDDDSDEELPLEELIFDDDTWD